MCLCYWELKGERDGERSSRISQPLKPDVGEYSPVLWTLCEANTSTFCYHMTLQSDAPVWRQFSVTPESSVHSESGMGIKLTMVKCKIKDGFKSITL